MKHTKLFTLFTAAILSVSSILPDAALTAAAEEIPAEGAVSEAGSFQIAGSDNTFGAMLAAEINQENARVMSGCVIHGVEMQGNTAEVSLEANRGGTAVVCVYTDPSCNEKHVPKLLASGMQTFTADQKSVSVQMAMDSLPAFYLIRAYLIGENQVPLSMEYTDPTHTLEMQQLIDSDISDYADYQVLNMDDSTDTNFAVYKQDVQVLKTSGTENLVTAQDNENCTYTIQNYTGPTKAGTVVSVEGGNGTAAIFRIQSVKKSGNVTTVQGSTAMDPQDAFAYIKVETNSENNEYSYTAPTPEGEYADIPISGEVVGGEKPAQGRPSVSAAADSGEEDVTQYAGDKMFRLQLGKGEDAEIGEHSGIGIELNGIAEFHFSYDVTIYHTDLFDHISFNFAETIDFGFELACTAGVEIPLGTAVIFNPCSKINFTLGPYLKASVTGIVKLTGTFESAFGTETIGRVRSYVSDLSLSVEGFIGFGIGGKLQVGNKGGELSLEAGIKATLEQNEHHEGCESCWGLTLNAEVAFTAKLEGRLFDIGVAPTRDFQLGKFYLSDTQGFGPGDCPNLQAHQSFPEVPEQEQKIGDDGLTDEQRNFYIFYQAEDGYGITSASTKPNEEGSGIYLPTMPTYYKGVPVTEIDDHAFSHYHMMEHVILPKKLKHIGAYAFSGCVDNSLSRYSGIQQPFLYIPDTVETIGDHAFSHFSVESLHLPDSLNTIGDHAFTYNYGGPYSLKSLTIPGSVQNIGQNAFYMCSNLETLTLQEGITEIPDSAFAGCGSLKNVYLPSTLEKIGAGAFEGSPEFPIRLPNGLKSIGEKAFYFSETDSIDLYDVTIPATVTEIGANAFGNCRHINNLTIQNGFKGTFGENAFGAADAGLPHFNDIQNLYLPNNWETIPDRLFECTTVTRVHLPSRIRKIGEAVFQKSDVKQITFPKGVKTIGKGALNGNQMQSLVLPSSLTKIEDEAFSGSVFLKTLFIPKSVKTIGNRAFAGSSDLVEAEIPTTVESISETAFAGCDEIRIYFLNPDIVFTEDPDKVSMDYTRATICGYQGSTAQAFAKAHNIKFSKMEGTRFTTDTLEELSNKGNSIVTTKTFEHLKPNTVYNFYYQVQGEFNTENLRDLSQGVSDENGNLTVAYQVIQGIGGLTTFVRCIDDEEKPTETTTTTAPEVSTVRGDVNCDTRVDVSDAVLLARFCAEDSTVKISAQGLRNADVTKNGKPDSYDTTKILKFIARLIDSLE